MEVRIGVVHTPKELNLDVEGSADEIMQAIEQALGKDDGVLWLDAKGRKVGVPAERLAYIEIEADADIKRVGFGPATA
jgi:hypothetical protein